jgi:hypothetical protein
MISQTDVISRHSVTLIRHCVQTYKSIRLHSKVKIRYFTLCSTIQRALFLSSQEAVLRVFIPPVEVLVVKVQDQEEEVRANSTFSSPVLSSSYSLLASASTGPCPLSVT